MVRDRTRAEHLAERGYEVHEGNILQPWTLQGAGAGVDIAYYLIHSMGRGGSGDYERRDREGAEAFARMARAEGVGRVVYLGGLGEKPKSRHLKTATRRPRRSRWRDFGFSPRPPRYTTRSTPSARAMRANASRPRGRAAPSPPLPPRPIEWIR